MGSESVHAHTLERVPGHKLIRNAQRIAHSLAVDATAKRHLCANRLQKFTFPSWSMALGKSCGSLRSRSSCVRQYPRLNEWASPWFSLLLPLLPSPYPEIIPTFFTIVVASRCTHIPNIGHPGKNPAQQSLQAKWKHSIISSKPFARVQTIACTDCLECIATANSKPCCWILGLEFEVAIGWK